MPPQAQVGSVLDSIRGSLRLASIRIDIAESVFQLALCVFAKSVLRLASFLRGFSSRLFAALRGSSRLFAALRGFLAWLWCAALRDLVARFFAALLRGSSRLCCVFADFLSAVRLIVRLILPLKPLAKAWSLGLLFGRYLHREGIVMDHIVVIGVPRDLGLHL